jgi:hypothetical protein
MLKKILFSFLFAFCSLGANTFEPNWAIVDSLIISSPNRSINFIDIKSFNDKEIIALANVSFVSPHIIKSTDGGFNWEIKLRFEEEPKKAFNLNISETGLASFGCEDGVYFLSSDFGETWEKNEIENKISIGFIGFWDDDIGMVQQMTVLSPPFKTILHKTTDGGNSWYEIDGPPIINVSLYYFLILESGICLAIEVDNSVDNTYYIHKSTDYGESWTTYSGPEVPPYGDFYFYNENLGFCLGSEDLNLPGGHSKLIRRTSDGGKTWERVLDTIFAPNNRVVSVHFSDSLNGAASTLKDVLLTHDGGLTWYVDSLYKSMKFPAGITEILMLDKDNILGVAFNPYEFIYRYTGVDPSSVSQSFPIKQLKLFPNPTHELLQIELADEHIYTEYLIYNAKGALLQKSLFTGEVPIGNLPKGAYYLLLYSPTRTGYGQFVKE